MVNKGFYSAIILIFVLAMFSFFLVYNNNSDDKLLDDSPRYLTLKIEEAYSKIDIELSSYYLDLLENNCELGAKSLIFWQEYKTRFNNTNLNEYCVVKNMPDNELPYNVSQDKFDINIPLTLNCKLIKDNKILEHNKDLNFRKRFYSAIESDSLDPANTYCHIYVTDLDADLNYIDTSINTN